MSAAKKSSANKNDSNDDQIKNVNERITNNTIMSATRIIDSQPLPAKKVKKDKLTSVQESQNDEQQNKLKNKVGLSKQKIEEQAKEHVKGRFNEENNNVGIKKMMMGNPTPVDSHFPNRMAFSKIAESKGIVYATTLNQSDIARNNNKFYIMQVIENGPSDFILFCRWGRVGVTGQTSQMKSSTLQLLTKTFNSKLNQKIKRGYTIVEMNYEDDANKIDEEGKGQSDKKQKKNEQEVESQLAKQVQDLIRLIFDMKMMNNQMKEIGYDAKKMPLGKLSKSSIEKGYEALNILMQQAKGQKRNSIFQTFSNMFFSNIPHDYGFIKMQHFILNTQERIKAKLQMLQSLQDIQVCTKIMNEGKISNDMNELDSNYLRLNTEIKPIDKNSELFSKLEKYVKNSHAQTHNSYRLEIEQIYRLNKEEQNRNFKDQIHNKQLLWHGSRLTNYVGILSQGLRIAPPEAPVTGYMFGKGVYFADMVSKSANYCCTSRANNIGLMILCEVALGNCWEKFASDYYASNLPLDKHSTKGVGRTAPLKGEMIEGAWAPNEVAQATNIGYVNRKLSQTSLLYNQFIVYDVNQIKFKYLFKMKFIYN